MRDAAGCALGMSLREVARTCKAVVVYYAYGTKANMHIGEFGEMLSLIMTHAPPAPTDVIVIETQASRHVP